MIVFQELIDNFLKRWKKKNQAFYEKKYWKDYLPNYTRNLILAID